MILSFNNITTKIHFESERERTDFERIRRANETMAPGAVYTPQFKKYKKTHGREGWSGRVNVIGKESFPTGLLPHVLQECWNRNRMVPTLVDERPQFPYLIENITLDLRDYQKAAISAAISNQLQGTWWPRGVIKMATGAGKTEVAVAMYQYIPVQTLFLVHLKTLLQQTVDRFKKYGMEVGQLGAGVHDVHPTGITVASMQTIASFIRREQDLSFLSQIKQVFFDEAHLMAASIAKGNTFIKISEMLPRAQMRWGLTATPFMKDNYSNLLLLGSTGELLYEVKNQELIDRGFLTPPKIKIINVPTTEKVKNSWPECYERGVVLNNKRNDLIAKEFISLPKPCLIMCSRVSHTAILQNRIKGNVEVLHGESPLAARKKAVEDLKNGKSDGIICTTIFDEGVDIPEIKSLILAGAGRSMIKQLQKLGRGLRIASGKKEVVVVDFHDECCPTLKKHSLKRRKVWEDEGFELSCKG